MKTIRAVDYGIKPGSDITAELAEMLDALKEIQGEKTVIFPKGTYYLERSGCEYVKRSITNTTSAEEYENRAEVNMHYTPFYLYGISDLTLDGSGSVFVIDGKVTNMIISECKNIIVKNMQLKTVSPNMHKLTVKKSSLFSTVFELDKNSKYRCVDGKYEWYGNGYTLGFFENSNKAFWTGSIKPSDKNKLFRTSHPFMGATKITELKPYVFRASYPVHKPLQNGRTFYVFDAHRSDVGIFAEKSENISVFNIEQNFNYSLAYVAQDCKDLKIESCRFAPEKDSEIEIASLADFIQICMCSGKVTIKDCCFDGSADDALNVHGIHFGIKKIRENKITVAFMHPQTWGFNPLHNGDKIEFINPSTLISESKNKIIDSEMLDPYQILLTLEKAVPQSFESLVIEDVDRCPELVFQNNYLNRIITRGILYTSRGKAVIKDNHFISNTMSAVLLSDDAKSWYESGLCTDVTIANNIFEHSFATPVLIKPENYLHKGAVHSNIKIFNNEFLKYPGSCIKIKSTENIEIKNNKFKKGKALKLKNCNNIISDCE